VPNRSDGAAPLEMTELDNDDVILLNKRMHPIDYEKVVKISAGEAPDRRVPVQCPSVLKLRRDFPAIAMFCTGMFRYLWSSEPHPT